MTLFWFISCRYWVTKRLQKQHSPSLNLFPKLVHDALEIRHYWSGTTVCPRFQVNLCPQRPLSNFFFKEIPELVTIAGHIIWSESEPTFLSNEHLWSFVLSKYHVLLHHIFINKDQERGILGKSKYVKWLTQKTVNKLKALAYSSL